VKCSSTLASPLAAAALALGLAVTAGALAGSELVPVEIVDLSIPRPLTDVPGDPVAGRLTVRDTSLATCLICHDLPIPEDRDHGTIGPPLAGVGSRYSAAELRLRLVNPKIINPDTIMPAYYRLDGLNRVALPYQGKTLYTAQQIEDVVAYLMTLTEETEAGAP
jgi:sulfur-oxidizing protein SoxX